MTADLSLIVNDASIRTNYFVDGFIDHTVSGMIEALERTGITQDPESKFSPKEVWWLDARITSQGNPN